MSRPSTLRSAVKTHKWVQAVVAGLIRLSPAAAAVNIMFQTDYKRALSANKIVLPIVQQALNAHEIISLEDNQELCRLLDRTAGVDCITVDRYGVRGIALRIQWQTAYNTFSIRADRASGAETELAKRTRQISKGYFYPHLTAQIYLRSDDTIMSGGICRTADLYEYININLPELKARARTAPDGNIFLWVRFNELVSAGYQLLRIDENE